MNTTDYMRRALRLASRGLGWVEPNPMVGAVIVRDSRIIAQGYHRRFGGPHAEIDALDRCRASGVDPAGCELYVTLEPCCHQGKTPPCVDAVIEAGVSRVIVGMEDPNPAVSGKGIRRLQDAGIDVEVGVCQHEARQLNEAYIKRVTTGLPWVIAKWAQTLDGRIATRTGDSKWISNERSRHVAHKLRARVDAVVVGVGTVVADDPQLTARGVKTRRTARKIVVDPQLRLPTHARLLAGSGKGRAPIGVTIAVGERVLADRPAKLVELEDRGVEFVGLPPVQADPSRLKLKPLMTHLATVHSMTNVLVEGGSKLTGSLFQEGLVDQVLAFVAPRVLGDEAAIPVAQGAACNSISQAMQLSLHSMKRIGEDVLLDYRVGAGTIAPA